MAAKVAKPASPAEDLDQIAAGHSPDCVVLLREATRILTDYVDVLGGKDGRSRPADRRYSEGALCSDGCSMGLH
jgi:hypothetical protein